MKTVLMDVSFWAALLAALSYMVIGALWYSPLLFGKVWLKETKISQKEMNGYGRAIVGSFICGFIMSYLMGYFIAATHSTTVFYGAQIGFFIWLGFIATTRALGVLYSGHSWRLFFIDAGYLLVAALTIGGILGAMITV